MKKVFITGNTSGIGLALSELMISQGYDVRGGSRSTGWDVSEEKNFHKVYECDILVNNAYHKYGQLSLLKKTYERWQGQEKTIVNVGSAMKDIIKHRPRNKMNYNIAKKSVEIFSFWIADNDRKCRSMMYNPGFVDTPLARGAMIDWPPEEQQEALSRAMDVNECAKTILFMIEAKHTFREITHM